MSPRPYRSKLEVFRDVLLATRYASKKTRIIGLANLNPTTFQRHMALARAHGLIIQDDGDYRLTEKADQVLTALQELVVKSRELDDGVQSFGRSALSSSAGRRTDGVVLRYVSRLAWAEIRRSDTELPPSFARSAGISANPGGTPDSPRDILEILSALHMVHQPSSVILPPEPRFAVPMTSADGKTSSRNGVRTRS